LTANGCGIPGSGMTRMGQAGGRGSRAPGGWTIEADPVNPTGGGFSLEKIKNFSGG